MNNVLAKTPRDAISRVIFRISENNSEAIDEFATKFMLVADTQNDAFYVEGDEDTLTYARCIFCGGIGG